MQTWIVNENIDCNLDLIASVTSWYLLADASYQKLQHIDDYAVGSLTIVYISYKSQVSLKLKLVDTLHSHQLCLTVYVIKMPIA